MTVAALLWVGLFRLTLTLVVVLALIRGGGPERLAAVLFAIAAMLSQPVLSTHHAFHRFQPSVACVDLGVLLVLWTISIYANRWWPMLAAGAQLISCVAHMVKLLHPEGDALSYERMAAFSAWPTLIFLQAGTTIHLWKLRAGADLSWNKSPPQRALRILRRLRMD